MRSSSYRRQVAAFRRVSRRVIADASRHPAYVFAGFIRDVSERRQAELEVTRERVQSFSLPRDFWEGEASS
jgi:hypothetical protein